MKTPKKILLGILSLLLIPVVYVIVSLLLTSITIDNTSNTTEPKKQIYLDIAIPKIEVESHLLNGIKHNPEDEYLSFGWGDENFYINTPTWGDLTLSTAVEAMLFNSTTLMHVTRYKTKQTNWVVVEVSKIEIQKLNAYIQNSFQTGKNGNKIILENESYSTNDEFYKANGSYTCFNTCNTWANTAFKESGLKSCLWTPFDFGLINKYE